MTIYPAVDLLDGKAVRLARGKREAREVYAENPLDAARKWAGMGAKWLHIVDLDAAFDGASGNLPLLAEMARLPVKTQIGGGIRDLEYARALLDLGAHRLIIGTVALEQPELFEKMAREFPGRVGVSLDAEGGQLKTRGWKSASPRPLLDSLRELEEAGAAFFIYTDIERDGMRSGINLPALETVLETVSAPVIAAGGVSSLDDIKRAAPLKKHANFDGVISGRALYENDLNLAEALAWLEKGAE